MSVFIIKSKCTCYVLLCTTVGRAVGLLFVQSWLWPLWFGRHSPPCGRHGLFLGPLSFVAVMDLAVMVFRVAVMVCGRHSRSPVPLTVNLLCNV